uniref:Transmembrane protein n=1 Tax=Physcomitrium patens TaxID=3218 RepID=A0A7I4CUP3_PHYPA
MRLVTKQRLLENLVAWAFFCRSFASLHKLQGPSTCEPIRAPSPRRATTPPFSRPHAFPIQMLVAPAQPPPACRRISTTSVVCASLSLSLCVCVAFGSLFLSSFASSSSPPCSTSIICFEIQEV